MLAVRFEEYGDRDVLEVVEVDDPEPGPGQVLVRVRAAGINPGESAIRSGAMREQFPSTFPSGQGSDLAGVVTGVGDGVTTFLPGDEVLGFSWDRSSHAELCAVPAEQLVRKPPELPWTVAGSLYVVGVTAFAALRAIGAAAGDVVGVSAAAGGVGSVVVQLAQLRGAEVVGIASAGNHAWLRSLKVAPVAYGDGLADRVRALAPHGLTAFVDTFGPPYVDLAVDLGVAPDRIETIIDFAGAQRVGARSEGSVDASTAEVLEEMADLVAGGLIRVPVASTYPLADVRDAYAELERRHTRGKIVLTM